MLLLLSYVLCVKYCQFVSQLTAALMAECSCSNHHPEVDMSLCVDLPMSFLAHAVMSELSVASLWQNRKQCVER